MTPLLSISAMVAMVIWQVAAGNYVMALAGFLVWFMGVVGGHDSAIRHRM